MPSHLPSFLALAAVLVAIPGPAATLVMKNAIARGLRPALATAAGVLAADVVWMAASVAGLTALLAASEPLFLAVRVAGAVYLVVLGLRLLLARREQPAGAEAARPRRAATAGRSFREGVVCDLSNPKTVLVFTSVIPQFLGSGGGGGRVAGLVVLGGAFALCGFASLAVYAVAFAQARRVAARPALRRLLLRLSGAVLVAFGVRVALEPAR